MQLEGLASKLTGEDERLGGAGRQLAGCISECGPGALRHAPSRPAAMEPGVRGVATLPVKQHALLLRLCQVFTARARVDPALAAAWLRDSQSLLQRLQSDRVRLQKCGPAAPAALTEYMSISLHALSGLVREGAPLVPRTFTSCTSAPYRKPAWSPLDRSTTQAGVQHLTVASFGWWELTPVTDQNVRVLCRLLLTQGVQVAMEEQGPEGNWSYTLGRSGRGHRLVPHTQTDPQHPEETFCNECGAAEHYEHGHDFYGCEQCNYDLCKACREGRASPHRHRRSTAQRQPGAVAAEGSEAREQVSQEQAADPRPTTPVAAEAPEQAPLAEARAQPGAPWHVGGKARREDQEQAADPRPTTPVAAEALEQAPLAEARAQPGAPWHVGGKARREDQERRLARRTCVRAALRGAVMAPAAPDPAELPFSERRRIFSGGASGKTAPPARRPSPLWPPALAACAGGAQETPPGHRSPLSACSTDASSAGGDPSMPDARCRLAEVEAEPEPEEASGGGGSPATRGPPRAAGGGAVEEQCVARIAQKLQRLAGRVESLEEALGLQQRAGPGR
ncbi:unnamed protein product [Prorocentrum cordatum]|uniref:ZZ-type domain-containing protein n=1 Tax=Prorocentrum cordatum TaxID=2364126 RepID=A0ABN9R5F0_9DINO|nr:unnamed protein product [Polarella glacialis]